jgi:hypothetical protein
MRIFLSLLLAAPLTAYGQQDTAKGPVSPWKHTMVAAFNLTQVAFSNWAQGGENAFAWTTSVDEKSVQTLEKSEWVTAVRLAYGQAKLQSSGVRKTDDVIDFATTYTFKMGSIVNPYIAATLKSQFTDGFDYGATNSPRVSTFFDPAYVTQSAGVGYQPITEIKTRLGAALKETFTNKFPKYANDPTTPVAEWVRTRVEGGLESTTEIEWKFALNMTFQAKVDFFAPFKTMDRITVRADAAIAAKVNDYVQAGFSVQLINDWRVTPRTQAKQTLAFGLSYAVL